MESCFNVTHEGHVAHIQLNRPDELNTMTAGFWTELPEIVHELDRSGEVRAIVVSSTGKHFSAGMDLGVFSGGSEVQLVNPGPVSEEGRKRAHFYQLVQKLQDSFTCFEQVRMPVLAAIQGGCIGGAVDMVTAADMRYCTSDAFFCIQEINIGMTADVGTLQRIGKVMPEGMARELAYTGDRLPAAEALRLGLVNRVYDSHDELVSGVMDIAQRIATRSPLAIWGTKEQLNWARDHTVSDSLRFMAAWQSGMFQPGDMVESFMASSEKRDPDFEQNPQRP